MKPLAQLFVVVMCLSCVRCHAEDATHNSGLPLVTLTGADSHVKERGFHRIASQDEWIKIWQLHKGVVPAAKYDLFYNPLGLPYINFDKCMVIAVFAGNGWNTVELKPVSVGEDESTITLRYRSKGYQTAGPSGGGKKVAAYAFFVLPRSSKTVIVQSEERTLKPDPPVVKEQARLTE